MHPLLIIMAVLGCADDGSQCQLVQRLPATYTSVAACNAAAEAELGRLSDLNYPTIMAQCQADSDTLIADAAVPVRR